MMKTTNTPDPHRIEWNLLQNAIDFVRSGVELFFAAESQAPTGSAGRIPFVMSRSSERPEHAYKYAILHIHAGCLLLFKERLRREHEALVYKNVDQAGLATRSGKASESLKTVDFDQAISRLEGWASLSLSQDVKRSLRWLQEKRNELEHYQLELNRREVESRVSETVAFAYLFLRDELGVELEEEISPQAWVHVSALREIAERIEAERRRRLLEFDEHYRTAPLSELEELADVDPYHPKHNPDPFEPLACDECGEESLFLDPGGEVLVCTNPECRTVHSIEGCERCGRMITGTGWCSDCESYFQYQMEKD